jgi:C-terminal processing protease CtpA/Prc
LSESIFPFINATDSRSYKIAFLKLAASLNDGHGYITIEEGYPNESQDIIENIEGKTVVKIDSGELNKGDIVICIGERDINHIRDSLAVLIPASTPGNKEYRINCYVAEMIFSHETDITISRNGRNLTVHTLPVTFETGYQSPYRWISDDIGYVDLSLLTTDVIDLVFLSFSYTKGIIFDLRKTGPYQYDVRQLECHLFDKKITNLFSAIVPDITHPGAYFWLRNRQDVIPDSIKCLPFKGKIVFLIDEGTQSFTETQAWMARTNFHAVLIGRTTSGALGQVVWAFLPGNNKTVFSGFGLFSPDGTGFQRKGIIPDIEVYPTMESIQEGKDEILEVAIEYLNKNSDLRTSINPFAY